LPARLVHHWSIKFAIGTVNEPNPFQAFPAEQRGGKAVVDVSVGGYRDLWMV